MTAYLIYVLGIFFGIYWLDEQGKMVNTMESRDAAFVLLWPISIPILWVVTIVLAASRSGK